MLACAHTFDSQPLPLPIVVSQCPMPCSCAHACTAHGGTRANKSVHEHRRPAHMPHNALLLKRAQLRWHTEHMRLARTVYLKAAFCRPQRRTNHATSVPGVWNSRNVNCGPRIQESKCLARTFMALALLDDPSNSPASRFFGFFRSWGNGARVSSTS
eukprot:10955637-Alexandrium_andersonii.AAC.1